MVTWKRSGLLACGALAIAAVMASAGEALWSAPRGQDPPPASERSRPGAQRVEQRPLVSTLHDQATSAYHARLFVDDEGVVLITRAGFTTLRAGSAPEEHEVSLGPVAVRRGGDVVFWRSGKLRSVSLSGAHERELAAVPLVPQYLLAADGQLAWIHTQRQTGATLQTLVGGEVRVSHVSQDSASAPVLHRGVVYWVAEARDGSWSIRGIGLGGGPLRSTPAHQGRPPAMLSAGREGVYFYAGPQRGVRRLTFDLQQEAAASVPVICSPLVVSSRVVCAQVGGIFDISPSASAPRLLAEERAGPITALAATDERAYWVAERGDEGLLVRSVALPAP